MRTQHRGGGGWGRCMWLVASAARRRSWPRPSTPAVTSPTVSGYMMYICGVQGCPHTFGQVMFFGGRKDRKSYLFCSTCESEQRVRQEPWGLVSALIRTDRKSLHLQRVDSCSISALIAQVTNGLYAACEEACRHVSGLRKAPKLLCISR